jgi:hypothetical protein
MFLHRRWEDVAISADSRHIEGWDTTAKMLLELACFFISLGS